MSLLETMQDAARTQSPRLFVLTPSDADALALAHIPSRFGIADIKIGGIQIVSADVEESFLSDETSALKG